MNIIFEDKSIIVCFKPQGILSQSDSKGNTDAISQLEAHTHSPIFPVHRLDKGTEGLIVFAKTSRAAAALSAQILSGEFKKAYIALCHGIVNPKSGILEDLLFYDRAKGKTYIVKRKRNGVKKAILQYETIKNIRSPEGDLTLLNITLQTGRTHQIRVQLASRGYPLLGDRRYGAVDNKKQIHLTSAFLSFMHPETKEILEFKAEPTYITE